MAAMIMLCNVFAPWNGSQLHEVFFVYRSYMSWFQIKKKIVAQKFFVDIVIQVQDNYVRGVRLNTASKHFLHDIFKFCISNAVYKVVK